MSSSVRYIVCLFLVVGILTTHSGNIQAQHTKIKTLTVGSRVVDGSVFHYRVTRLIEELKERTGIELTLKRLPNLRSLTYSNEGIIDGEIARVRSLSKNPKYPNLKIVDAPWMEATLKAIVKKGSHVTITGWDSLKLYQFCYRRGTLLIERMMEEHHFSGIPLTAPMQALKQIDSGRCDVTVFWYDHYGYEELKFLNDNDLVPVYDFVTAEGLIYLHKSHEALIPKIREVLLEIEGDGTRKKIFEESNINISTGGVE